MLDFYVFPVFAKFYVQALFSTRRARSIIAASLVPSVVPTKVVAQARVNLLTAIHELKVAFCLAALLVYGILRHCRSGTATLAKTGRIDFS
jgi:hypothetical protein